MPQASQGDIFQAAARVDLAIVFGHIGFNEMRQCWVDFARNQSKLSRVHDPFTRFPACAVEWSSQKWLWFVPEKENHGMTEMQLMNALDVALVWASQNGIKSVVTNGVANTDHGHDTAANRRSDKKRAVWLIDYFNINHKVKSTGFQPVSFS